MRGELRRHHDAALATVVLIAGLVAGVSTRREVLVECLVALVLAGAVAVRRRWPLISLSTVQAAGVAVTALHLVGADTAGFVIADLVLVYTVATVRSRPGAAVGMTVSVAAFWSEDAMLGHRAFEYVFSAVLVAAPWIVGRYVRRERELRVALLAAVQSERSAVARAAVADERRRIAREMHQIVTRGLAAIAVRSCEAESALETAPRCAHEPVRQINDTARHCVAEMRALLTVLRNENVVVATEVSEPLRERGVLRFGVAARFWSARDHILTGVVLVAGSAVVAAVPNHRLYTAALYVAASVIVAARRRNTLAALACCTVVAVIATAYRPLAAVNSVVALTSLVLLFTAGMRRDHCSLVALGIGLGGFWSVDAMNGHPPSGYLASAVTVGGAWSVGAVIARMQELRSRVTTATAAEHRAVSAGAAAEERHRLAREMHDVVAHGLSAIAVQSAAADAALDVDAPLALTAVRTVASLAEQCATEMAQLLDVLGAAQPEASVVSADLRAVLAAQESLGLDVRKQLDDSVLDAAGPVVALAATRIVQEALTNVRRHSCAATARVEIGDIGGSLRVTITDPGPPRAARANGSGHGTTGIRERANALGGACAIGPCDDGWRVEATLPTPIRAAESAPQSVTA